jgi:hypothetical protein
MYIQYIFTVHLFNDNVMVNDGNHEHFFKHGFGRNTGTSLTGHEHENKRKKHEHGHEHKHDMNWSYAEIHDADPFLMFFLDQKLVLSILFN